ncbi:MAG: aminotransferase class V-fold PLP-dependent enzyme [Acidobacteria bacterium]|nr:aminotransferase class V-fold PLP-dependent enzyme [Acidobacteriota bacterium]
MAARFYLDFNASHPILPEALAAMVEVLRDGGGNPSSPHAEGRLARQALEEARRRVAWLLRIAPAGVVFVSGGTEANASGLWGLLAAGGRIAGRSLLVSAAEHPAVHAAAAELSRQGVRVSRIPVDPRGIVDLEALERLCSAADRPVVALQLANSETGVLQPVPAAAALVRAAGGRLHCDAVQAAGKVEVHMAALGADTLAIAGHKIGGAPGAAALAVVDGIELAPLIPGTQERHRRGGTENVAAAVAMGVAAGLVEARLASWRDLEPLRDRFEADLLERIHGTEVFGARATRLPNTSCFALPEPFRGDATVAALDLDGFAVSSGPACSSGVGRSSGVLEAMGAPPAVAARSVRLSLGSGVTEGVVSAILDVLQRVARRAGGGGT